MFIRLGIPTPFTTGMNLDEIVRFSSTDPNPALLIYGASTSLGLYVLQLARLARTAQGQPFRLFCVAERKNHALLNELGADGVVDYREADWVERVRAMVGEQGVSAAFDCISEGSTTGDVSRTFGKGGGRIATIRGNTVDKSKIRAGVGALYGAVWSGLGVEVGHGSEWF